MKHLFRLITAAALLTSGWSFAAEAKSSDAAAPNGSAQGEQAKGKHRPANPDQLTPEERQAKRKEMAAKREAKLKELKAKKAAGSLTAKEEKQLVRLEHGGRPVSGAKVEKKDSDAK